jgi:hypothetical protein
MLSRYTRKSVRQTFWTGIVLTVVSVLWLVGSIAATPSLSPDAHVWISLIPFLMLVMAGAGFLGAWLSWWFSGPYDDDISN